MMAFPAPRCWLGAVLVTSALGAGAYPIDGYEHTGIGRLEAQRRIEAGMLEGRSQPAGAHLPLSDVDVRLADAKAMALPGQDPALSSQLSALLQEMFGAEAANYGVALLDLSRPDAPRYGEHQGELRQNPGSVGKLLVAVAIFQALADLYPEDVPARLRILREGRVTADEFILTDSHRVGIWDRDSERLIRRPLALGDTGSLFEFLDWMISPSSNAAAAMCTKHAVLLRHFGREYPVGADRARAFIEHTPPPALGELLATTLQSPVTRNGLDVSKLRQGSLFTRSGKRLLPGTTSYATPRALVRLMWRMERGLLVDRFSSMELKRLMYVTERRIRYASSPALRDAAVYFKSGSLYRCRPEPGYRCLKYRGNALNLLNSIAIVEAPAAARRLHYVVAVMSNVKYRNSAVDHQTLATRIHRLVERHHAETPPSAAPAPVPPP